MTTARAARLQLYKYQDNMMKKWSDEAWQAALPVYRKIIQHPFVDALARGTLDNERFMFYLRQDSLYLARYSRALTHIASRLADKDHTAAFIRFASDGTAVEKALHESFLQGSVPDQNEISPACLLYTSLLGSQAAAPVEVEAAAVLPCFWVYQRVGADILSRQQGDNPYMRWIETYGDEAFAASTAEAVAICDSLAEAAGADTRRMMTDIFVRCTKMEWMFWDSAWRLEQWPI